MLHLLVLLYMLNNKPILEQKTFATIDQCKEAVEDRIKNLNGDPRVMGLFAACIHVEGNKS